MEEATRNFTVAGNKETASAGKCLIQLSIAGPSVKTSTLVLQGNLTGLVPSASFHMTEPIHGLKMADPKFIETSQIDVSLGAELYVSLGLPGVERSGEIVFTNTIFGYVASGAVSEGHYHVQLSIQLKHFMMISKGFVKSKKSFESLSSLQLRHQSKKFR